VRNDGFTFLRQQINITNTQLLFPAVKREKFTAIDLAVIEIVK
jgi:hypothetical protein